MAGIKGDIDPEISFQQPDLSDLTLINHLFGLDEPGQKPGPQGFHQEPVLFSGLIDHVAHFKAVNGKRFFTQHMFAVVKAHDGILTMQVMRCGNINNIHIGIRGQFLIATIGFFCPKLAGKLPGGIQVS